MQTVMSAVERKTGMHLVTIDSTLRRPTKGLVVDRPCKMLGRSRLHSSSCVQMKLHRRQIIEEFVSSNAHSSADYQFIFAQLHLCLREESRCVILASVIPSELWVALTDSAKTLL